MDTESSKDEFVDNEEDHPSGDQSSWLLPLMDHVESQVVFGDTKAGLLLAANSFLIAALVAAATGENPVIADLHGPARGLAVLAFTSITVSIVLALLAIKPCRPNLWISATRDQETPSLVQFSRIATQRRKDYVATVLNASPKGIDHEIASVIHGKAAWATHKFQRLYLAVCATLLGVCTGALAVTIELIYRAT